MFFYSYVVGMSKVERGLVWFYYRLTQDVIDNHTIVKGHRQLCFTSLRHGARPAPSGSRVQRTKEMDLRYFSLYLNFAFFLIIASSRCMAHEWIEPILTSLADYVS